MEDVFLLIRREPLHLSRASLSPSCVRAMKYFLLVSRSLFLSFFPLPCKKEDKENMHQLTLTWKKKKRKYIFL